MSYSSCCAFPASALIPPMPATCRRTAEWLAAHLHALGLESARVMPTAGHPVVYAEWLGAGPDKPTVLVYGHYDVVPAVMEDGWDTPPFEPVEKDGKIYARGATDNKGQLFIHIKALESYLEACGEAPVNVKILLEGEEEISSPNLTPFIKEHLDLLKADVCVISDTSMRSIEEPAITHSLRGMTYIEIEVEGPKEDLHSGLWGGAAHNPALALVEILGKLYNPDHTIAVPGFYDDVVPLTRSGARNDRQNRPERGAVQSRRRASRRPGATRTTPSASASLPARRWTSTGCGAVGPVLVQRRSSPKRPVPSSALAWSVTRIRTRSTRLLKKYIESIAPKTVKVSVSLLTTGLPALIPFDLPEMQAASRAYEKAWGYTPVFTRGGGSIPVVADIANLLKIPVVMMGYGLDSDGLHSPNEHYSLEMFHRGIETAIVYLEELAQITNNSGKDYKPFDD